MQDALSRYYNNRDPFGVNGDFITAPEISQLFGEIIGIWAIQKWMDMGSPAAFNLIELGPGRGTLMADLLRGTQHVKGFQDALSVHLVESSNILRKKQKETLQKNSSLQRRPQSLAIIESGLCRSDDWVYWHDHLQDIPTDTPAIIIANEFFDALPIRQFKYDNGWHELYIKEQEFCWLSTDKPLSKDTLPPPSKGDVYEYSEAQADYAKLISAYKGAALIIDYGYEKSAYGDTLQALHKHQPCAINDHIGEADLTSHIDFEWLSHFFQNTQLKTQAQFLQENGIAIRYHQLNNPKLRSGYERIIHPEQMGALFKVMDITL